MAAGASPPLRLGDDLIALPDGAHADGVNLRACSGRGRVDVRATFRAKRLWPLVAAFSGLDIDFWLAREQPESIFPRKGVHAECRPGEHLAVSAIAKKGLVQLNLGFKCDVSAVTAAVNFHLSISAARLRARSYARVPIRS